MIDYLLSHANEPAALSNSPERAAPVVEDAVGAADAAPSAPPPPPPSAPPAPPRISVASTQTFAIPEPPPQVTRRLRAKKEDCSPVFCRCDEPGFVWLRFLRKKNFFFPCILQPPIEPFRLQEVLEFFLGFLF